MANGEGILTAMVESTRHTAFVGDGPEGTARVRARHVLRAALEAAGFGEGFDAWWLPPPADGAYAERLRRDYEGEGYEGMSDEEVLDAFGYTLGGFADTWDHVRDARDAYQEIGKRIACLLAAAYPEGEEAGDAD